MTLVRTCTKLYQKKTFSQVIFEYFAQTFAIKQNFNNTIKKDVMKFIFSVKPTNLLKTELFTELNNRASQEFS